MDRSDGLRTPPANVEAEKAVLGSILVYNDVFVRVQEFLHADHFAFGPNGMIYEACGQLIREGRVADPISLRTWVEQNEAFTETGGVQYLIELAGSAVARTNAEEYARYVADLAARRRAIEMVQEGYENLYRDVDVSTAEEVQRLMGGLETILHAMPRGGRRRREVAEKIVESLALPPICYSTGIPALDDVLAGGFYPGKLYAIAARKKVGKTKTLNSISYNLNQARVPHLFIVMESSSEELEQINAARHQGFNTIRFLKRDDADLARRVADYAVMAPDFTIYEDMPGATFEQVRGCVARHIAVSGIKGVILDYWQRVRGKGRNETEEYHLRNVADWMADTTKDSNIFFLTAAQVNQDGNTRGGEGLKLACDVYFTLHRNKDEKGAWLEMEESRYTMYQNVGSADNYALWMDPHGPHFRDIMG